MPYGSQVRSFRIGAGQLTAGALSTIHSVPLGFTTLVKDISLQNYASGSTGVDILVTSAGLNIVVARLTVPGNGVARLSPWWAVPEDEEITVWNGTVGTLAYYVSGALLPGVADVMRITKPA
jgi:hypothetical protein